MCEKSYPSPVSIDETARDRRPTFFAAAKLAEENRHAADVHRFLGRIGAPWARNTTSATAAELDRPTSVHRLADPMWLTKQRSAQASPHRFVTRACRSIVGGA